MKRLAAALLVGVALCATPALADPTDEEPESERIDPDYAAGKKAIEAKDWTAAIRMLSSAALRDTRNADIQNGQYDIHWLEGFLKTGGVPDG